MKRIICLAVSLLILMSAFSAYVLFHDELLQKAAASGVDDVRMRSGKPDAAFDSGNPTLSETGSAIIEPQVSDFEISDEAKAALAESLHTEDIEAALTEALGDTEFILLSKSPAGSSGFVSAGASAITAYNGKYHIAFPSAKGVPDEYANLGKYSNLFNSRFRSLIGEEGIVYSADGRYAAICNKSITLVKMNLFLDPVLIDLSTGELILTATYASKISADNAGAMTSAVFSSNNRYFYYILYGRFGEARTRLYRYALDTGETELCFESGMNLYYPHLAELEDGSFLMLNDCYKKDETEGLVIASCNDGAWSVDETKLKLDRNFCYANRLLYSPDSGLACLLENTISNTVTFQIINPNAGFDGLDTFWCIRKDTDEITALSPEEFSASIDEDAKDRKKADGLSILYPYQSILNAVFSPDGNYILLHTANNSAKGMHRNLFLVRLEDMTLRKVSGLDANSIRIAASATVYPMSIEWNTEELIIGTDDGIRTFEFTVGD